MKRALWRSQSLWVTEDTLTHLLSVTVLWMVRYLHLSMMVRTGRHIMCVEKARRTNMIEKLKLCLFCYTRMESDEKERC